MNIIHDYGLVKEEQVVRRTSLHQT